jgi:hypothetical protein
MFSFDFRVSRPVTCELLDNVEQGVYDKDRMIADLLGWMSEADVAEFARRNEYLIESEEDEDEVDPDDTLDDFNYVGSRHHY